jgi:hypothetical protein
MATREARPVVDPFTRCRIERIADRALRSAGVLGRLPTPLEEVQSAAGILARRDIAALPAELATPGRALLGALWFEERTLYVDLSQPEPRRRFTDAHEAMHALCPWHEATLREDTEAELFRATRAAIEAEANHGAAELIFQGRAFRERLAAMPAEIASARALAAEHGASLRATLHQLAADHPSPVALLVVSRFPDPEDGLRVWGAVTSPAYRRLRGPGPRAIARDTPLRALIEAARGFQAAPPTAISLDGAPCVADVHYNRRCFLVLLSVRRLARRAA